MYPSPHRPPWAFGEVGGETANTASPPRTASTARAAKGVRCMELPELRGQRSSPEGVPLRRAPRVVVAGTPLLGGIVRERLLTAESFGRAVPRLGGACL